MHINPLVDIGVQLQSVQNPSRYLGGEYGQIIKKDANFTCAIAFPDLYEIAMSNQAIKIIYNGLNRLHDIRCERVFAVDVDFEELLRKKNIPLYTLETGIPLHRTDMIGFSIGYELGITAVLSMLDLGGIPLKAKDRSDCHPIVFAGGCGVTNPAPFSQFFDAIFIGEAEDELFDLVKELAKLKSTGVGRSELLKVMCAHPAVWVPGKKARRAIQSDFGTKPSVPAYYPLPSIEPVQDHGVVEIMRGCPNGCRFCHAGIYYRPQRMKTFDIIMQEVDELVNIAGYREISLTSLSSGDYMGIGSLLDALNERYASKQVSFQLPSLKVSSFTLPILEKVSKIRKSGLTFAIETPVEAWQFSINKEVFEEKLYTIIMDAKKRGWNKAKFYFMVGLPVGSYSGGHPAHNDGKNYIVGAPGTEEREIVDFMLNIQKNTRIQCNVNVGTFVPKPHTPYQWAAQLTMQQSREKLYYIRSSLPKGKFRVSTHDEFVSFIDGMISRGDERVGDIVLAAYQKGCRLDAWDDHIKKDFWREAIDEVQIAKNWSIENQICHARSLDEKLPWDDVSLGPVKSFYVKEWERSLAEQRSPLCLEKCVEACGVCNKTIKVHANNGAQPTDDTSNEKIKTQEQELEQNIPVLWRAVFSFSKQNGGEYLPHLALVENFHKSFLRSELPIMYTNGFNPLPKFELASSLSLGIHSECEIASIMLRHEISESDFKQKLAHNIPPTLHIEKVFIFPVSNKKKRESLASILWGSEYTYNFSKQSDNVYNFIQADAIKTLLDGVIHHYNKEGNVLNITLPFTKDRAFRNAIAEYFDEPIYECVDITKNTTLAKPIFAEGVNCGISFFEIYKDIAILHKELIDT